MTELEQLLTSLRSVGPVDSSSRFHLDQKRAREVLDQYRLPGPAYVVVKLVQALVGLGAEQISVRLRKQGVLLHGPGARLEQPEQLAHELASIQVAQDEPLDDLVIGLRSSLAQGFRLAACHLFDGSASWLTVVESGLAERFGPMRLGVRKGRPELKLHLSRSQPDRDQTAEIHRLLSRRFCWSPVPIKLDGRSLELPVTALPGLNPPFLLADQVWADKNGWVVPPRKIRLWYEPQLRVDRSQPVETLDTLLRVGQARQAWGYLALAPEGEGQLYVVRRGFLATPRPLTGGLWAVVRGEQLGTDISRISLRQDQRYQDLLDQLEKAQQDLALLALYHHQLGLRSGYAQVVKAWVLSRQDRGR